MNIKNGKRKVFRSVGSLEAWDGIHKIVEVFENEYYDYPEDRIKTIMNIEEILKKWRVVIK